MTEGCFVFIPFIVELLPMSKKQCYQLSSVFKTIGWTFTISVIRNSFCCSVLSDHMASTASTVAKLCFVKTSFFFPVLLTVHD